MKTKTTSTLLDGKPEHEILAPEPLPFVWKGKQYDIYPMPDSTLMKIGDSLANITLLFDGIASLDFGTVENAQGETVWRTFADLTIPEKLHIVGPIIPQIIRLLIPNASRVIAGCLRIEEEVVADEMRLADKLAALRLIVQLEDLPRIVGNFDALVEAFIHAGPTTA